MRARPPVPLEQSRLLSGAHLRRWAVYVVAGVLVVLIGTHAARMARPADPRAQVEVTALPGLGGVQGARTERVHWDPVTGQATIDVRAPDGTRHRYRIDIDDEGLRIRPGEEPPPSPQR